jgi:hypothetical protein
MSKQMLSDWKQARLNQIRKLYFSGSTRSELIERFGAQNVSDALDKTKRYN